jgi:hypothetical protein
VVSCLELSIYPKLFLVDKNAICVIIKSITLVKLDGVGLIDNRASTK